jgi:hypothetical protein
MRKHVAPNAISAARVPLILINDCGDHERSRSRVAGRLAKHDSLLGAIEQPRTIGAAANPAGLRQPDLLTALFRD